MPLIERPSVNHDSTRAKQRKRKRKPRTPSPEQQRRLRLLWWARRETLLRYLNCRKRVQLSSGRSRWEPVLPAIQWEWIASSREAGVHMSVASVQSWWARQRLLSLHPAAGGPDTAE